MNGNLSLAETDIYLGDLYGEDIAALEYQSDRYKKLFNYFRKNFEEPKAVFFSSPGRTELSGNHTQQRSHDD